MTPELQSTLEDSGIERPALWNHRPCMAHVIQLAEGAFMSSLSVEGHRKPWEAHERDQPFGGNQTKDIGKSERFRKEVNARINKMSAMKTGLAKIIEKVHISRYCENSETDHHMAVNASCVDYVDTGLLKGVLWLSKCQSTNCSPTYYGCENRVEFDNGVAWASLHQQQPYFPSETRGCCGQLWQLWRNLVPSDGELHASCRPGDASRCIASAKCIFVTGSPQECLRRCGV